MPALYRTTQTGEGTQASPYRAQGFDGEAFTTLMIGRKRPAMMVVANNVNITGAPTKMLEAPTLAELKTLAKTTFPTAQERQSLNAWANSQGLAQTTNAMNWMESVNFVVQQVSPYADFDRVFLRA